MYLTDILEVFGVSKTKIQTNSFLVIRLCMGIKDTIRVISYVGIILIMLRKVWWLYLINSINLLLIFYNLWKLSECNKY